MQAREWWSNEDRLASIAALEENVRAQDEAINHPLYYGGDTTYEAIKVIEAWGLGFCLGNTIKYISRSGKKAQAGKKEDLEKAAWYLNRAAYEQGMDLSIDDDKLIMRLERENDALAKRVDELEAQLLPLDA